MLHNQVALVTGASRGIGAATARALGALGACVAVNYYQSHECALRVVATIEEAGGRAMPVRADVRDPGAVRAMVNEVVCALGPIDTLVLNAHIDCSLKPFLLQDWAEFSSKLDGEMRAVYFVASEVVPAMRARGGGNIIAISSLAARKPEPGMSAQCAAKAALEGLMRAWATEWGRDGVRVNTVAPGLIETDLIVDLPEEVRSDIVADAPLGRVGRPEDVAGLVAWLATSEAGYLTGTTLEVNGGLFMA